MFERILYVDSGCLARGIVRRQVLCRDYNECVERLPMRNGALLYVPMLPTHLTQSCLPTHFFFLMWPHSSLTYISYVLLVCCHSLRWPTFRKHCSSGLILLAVLYLVGVASLASFSCSLTSRGHYLSGLILLADLYLVGIPHLPSFSPPDNISYALPIWPHSPCWPLLLCVAHWTSLPLTYIWTCARNAMLGITGLLLVHVARLLSFS